MKASKFIVCCLLAAAIMPTAYAINTDSARIADLETKLQAEITLHESMRSEISRLSAEQKKSNEAISALRSSDQKIIAKTDTIENAIMILNSDLSQTAEKLGVGIKGTNDILGTKADSKAVKQRTIIGVVFFALLAIICALIYILLHNRINKGSADIEALRKKADELNAEIVSKFSTEMAEMQNISASLSAISSKFGASSSEQDHSLIKTLADRITFMEMTLSKMDASVRGYKQLAKSISQMKDNLKANGYELVDMLGKAYKEGMNVTATFVDDENLEEGQQIITGIIKPQINYQGVMIQAAQITVSQNI